MFPPPSDARRIQSVPKKISNWKIASPPREQVAGKPTGRSLVVSARSQRPRQLAREAGNPWRHPSAGIGGATKTDMLTLSDDQLEHVTGGGALSRTGEALGFGAGVAVTGALALVPGWNTQVPGRPPGFQRRHESVVGPQVSQYANTLAPGAWRDFAAGVGRGATAAPPWSFEHGI